MAPALTTGPAPLFAVALAAAEAAEEATFEAEALAAEATEATLDLAALALVSANVRGDGWR